MMVMKELVKECITKNNRMKVKRFDLNNFLLSRKNRKVRR
jgi:hypothetical protein